MRRVAAVALLIAAAVAVVVVVLGAGDDGEEYKVRAIFENAGFVIPGEDVKVAGVRVGSIDSIDVTEDNKAAVVLDIEDPGYQDFRNDASCIVRPQSLIGERFVECTLTEQRAAGEEPPPELEQIEEGDGEGQYLLPVERNAKAVDIDLLNNIMRQPVRERLSIILSDLGIGVAGRGEDLGVVIRRADPALKEIDEVLKILAEQNDVLADLARDSDTILEPLARERAHVAGAIENSGEVAQATAEVSDALQADIERLPRFLRELKPTMVRLGALSDEMTPVLTDLGAVAPDINRMVIQLGPFSKAAIPAFESLGEMTETGTPAVRAALPVARDTRQLAAAAKPVGANARKLLESFQRTGGINRFDGLRLLPGGRDQRLRLVRPLPARRPDRQPVRQLRGPGVASAARRNFSRGRARAPRGAASAAPRDAVLQRTAAGAREGARAQAPEGARAREADA